MPRSSVAILSEQRCVMGFIVVALDSTTGSLRLVGDRQFATRVEALDAAREACESCDPGELTLLDLSTGAPILVVRTSAPLASAEAVLEEEADMLEPGADIAMAEDWGYEDRIVTAEPAPDAASVHEPALAEEPEEASEPTIVAVEQPYAEAVVSDLSGIPGFADDDPTALIDALHRAKDSLAAQIGSAGLVETPASDEPNLTAEESADEASSEETEVEFGAIADYGVVSELEPEPESEPEAAVQESEPSPAAWPWAGEQAAENVAEPADVSPYVPSPLEEPAVDASDLLTSAPEAGEDAFLPRPVIMGDYADSPAWTQEIREPAGVSPEFAPETPDEQTQTAEDSESDDQVAETAGEDITEAAPETGYEAFGAEAAGTSDRGELAAMAESLDALGDDEDAMAGDDQPSEDASPIEQALAEPLEEPTTDVTANTCDDCVYVNTCPQRGESDPSSCGLFQWRS